MEDNNPKRFIDPSKIGKAIGKGVEKTVTSYGEKNVLKIYENESDPTILKGRFYMAKILHILYPLTFPTTHNVGRMTNEMGDKKHSYIIAEKAIIDDDHRKMGELLHNSTAQHVSALSEEDQLKYRELESKMKEEGRGQDTMAKLSSLSVGFDKQLRNFSKDASGNDLYLDTVEAFKINALTGKPSLNYDKSRLELEIDKIPDEYSRKQALTYLSRLDDLLHELQD